MNGGDELNNISWCMALPFQPPASAMSRYTTLGKVRSRGEGILCHALTERSGKASRRSVPS